VVAARERTLDGAPVDMHNHENLILISPLRGERVAEFHHGATPTQVAGGAGRRLARSVWARPWGFSALDGWCDAPSLLVIPYRN
jgi:hypothetical protein